jgi:colanic acid/amylovoran biosynthesis glycosyltransferase
MSGTSAELDVASNAMTSAPHPRPLSLPGRGEIVRRRAKIAYLVNQYPQPSQSFIRREIRALEGLGYDVQRFTVRRWNGKLVDDGDRAENERTTSVLELGPLRLLFAAALAAVVRPLAFLRTLALAIRLGRRSDRGLPLHLVYFVEACALLKLLRRRGIEHVHAHFGTNSTTTALLCRALGGPAYSFTVHGPEEFDKPEFLHLGEKIARAAFVVAVSEFGRSQLFRTCEYRHWGKIHVVHCGVDASFHDVAPTAPPVEPRLVCVARLHEQKGLPILIDAAARLADLGTRFRLTIVGDGPLRATIEDRIAALGLAGVVELAGWKSNAEVRALIQQSRAMILPSFAEGLPVVIMEALALHRPVVSTYVAGIPELVENGVCGQLVPAGAVEPLVEAMRTMLEATPEELAALGAEGARRVRANHSADVEGAKLATLVERSVAAARAEGNGA